MDVSNVVKYAIQHEVIDDICWCSVGKVLLFIHYDAVGIDAMTLYMFLQLSCRLQSTNSVKASYRYIKRGLKWGNDRIIKARTLLMEFGLVSEKITKGSDGKITGHYLVIHTKKTPMEPSDIENNFDHIPATGTEAFFQPECGWQERNALTSNINALTNIALPTESLSVVEEADNSSHKQPLLSPEEQTTALADLDKVFTHGRGDVVRTKPLPTPKKRHTKQSEQSEGNTDSTVEWAKKLITDLSISANYPPYYHDGKMAKKLKSLETRILKDPSMFERIIQWLLDNKTEQKDKFIGSMPVDPCTIATHWNKLQEICFIRKPPELIFAHTDYSREEKIRIMASSGWKSEGYFDDHGVPETFLMFVRMVNEGKIRFNKDILHDRA